MVDIKMFLFGAILMSFIVSIQGLDVCKVDFKKVGCFKDSWSSRRLPDLLITDRDPSHENFGKMLIWSDFKNSVRSLLCRCSAKARSLGYRYIGIQYYAECWAGNTKDYALDGPSSECMSYGKEVCNLNLPTDCVGKGFTNFVYEILDCEDNKFDIAVLLDVSTSIQGKGLTAAKQFLKKLVDLVPVSSDGTHFSLVTFSSKANIVFDFKNSFNKGENNLGLKAAIDNIQSFGGGTWPDTALKTADQDLFTEEGGARHGVPKFVITLTDGSVHQGSVIAPIMWSLQTSKGVNLLSVGVGSDINAHEVNVLAFEMKANVFDGNDNGAAQNVASRIATLAQNKCTSSQAAKR